MTRSPVYVALPGHTAAIPLVEAFLTGDEHTFRRLTSPSAAIVDVYSGCISLAVAVLDHTQGRGRFDVHAQTVSEVLDLHMRDGLTLRKSGQVTASTAAGRGLMAFETALLAVLRAAAEGRQASILFGVPKDAALARDVFAAICGYVEVLLGEQAKATRLSGPAAALAVHRGSGSRAALM